MSVMILGHDKIDQVTRGVHELIARNLIPEGFICCGVVLGQPEAVRQSPQFNLQMLGNTLQSLNVEAFESRYGEIPLEEEPKYYRYEHPEAPGFMSAHEWFTAIGALTEFRYQLNATSAPDLHEMADRMKPLLALLLEATDRT
ncbi:MULTISPECIES: hypothetical protein [unclassified Thioalkalivibrio]|uniref:hypothetical protein n=1 Tax=unclassified Thioalkalivibrio TaxID=2621013 RepID=UPI000380787A|nr:MULTISPECIES: hypothetical protein [unclassified Thioalkalivibrio]